MTEGHRKRQKALKAAHGRLYTEVSRLLREADPIRLITIGAPDDEYDPEVSTILPRLREAHLRIYFDIEEEPDAVVYIRAVGIKERNRVRIGGKVIEL